MQLPTFESDDEEENGVDKDREEAVEGEKKTSEEDEEDKATVVNTTRKQTVEDQLFKHRTYPPDIKATDSDEEIEQLTKNLHKATKFVEKTQRMREGSRRRSLEDFDSKYAFETMEDAKTQEVAGVSRERAAAAASGDAVLEISESAFRKWTSSTHVVDEVDAEPPVAEDAPAKNHTQDGPDPLDTP